MAEHLTEQVSMEEGENSTANQSRAIDVQIGRLRQKIEVDAKNPQHIKTMRGQGYFFATGVKRLG